MDTLAVYNPEDHCSGCNEGPVEFIHWGALTQGKFVKFCKKCFVKKCNSEGQTLAKGKQML